MDKSIKAAQLADFIRDNLSSWLYLDFRNPYLSVTHVAFNLSMTEAIVWVTIGENDGALVSKINKQIPEYQRKLNHTLQRRKCPRLTFNFSQSSGNL